MTPASALDAARQVLPPAVGYANALVIPFAFFDALQACCNVGLCDEAEEMLREMDGRLKKAHNFDDGAPVAVARREVEACARNHHRSE